MVFEEDGEIPAQMEEEEFFDELEELMDEEEKHLITIDSRYVQHIEQENAVMRQELARLNCELREHSNLLLARIYTNLSPEQAVWVRSKLGL
jgi:hypothetical protein